MVMDDKLLAPYFPDNYASNRTPEREFFWGVLIGVKPNYARALVQQAVEQRNKSLENSPED